MQRWVDRDRVPLDAVRRCATPSSQTAGSRGADRVAHARMSSTSSVDRDRRRRYESGPILLAMQMTLVLCGGDLAFATDVDIDDVLALGNPIGVATLAPAIPTAICSLEGGGFAVVTEYPSQIFLLDQRGKLTKPAIPLPQLYRRPCGVVFVEGNRFVIADRSGIWGIVDLEGALVRQLPAPRTPWCPGALAKGPGGDELLATDRLRGEVFACDEKGALLRSWSGFIDPVAIAAVGRKLWVSDKALHRIVPVDRTMTEVDLDAGIGDHGSAPGLLSGPMGLCGVGDRIVLVADHHNHRVQVFGTHGISIHDWGLFAKTPRRADGYLHYPEAIAFDLKNFVCAVLEPSERRVQFYGIRSSEDAGDSSGSWQQSDLLSHFGKNWAVDRDGRLLAVAEADAERVTVFGRGQIPPFDVDDVGMSGALPAQFRTPTGIDFLPGTPFPRFVVADRGNCRLQLFEVLLLDSSTLVQDPTFIILVKAIDLALLTAQTPGWQAAVPPRLGGVACLDDGTIAVSDSANQRILLMNRQFRPQGVLHTRERLAEVSDLVADGSGLLVADQLSGTVLRFELEDRTVEVIESEAVRPVGVCRHPDGSIWITDAQRHALLRIPPEGGAGEVILEGPGGGEKELYRPRSVRIAEDGSVWVLDFGNHRGVVISPDGTIGHFGSPEYLPPTKTVSEEEVR